MLDQNIRAKTFWRMSVLLPFVVAPVAVALIFGSLFGDKYGLVNTILHQLRPRPDPLAHRCVRQPHRDRHDGQLPLDRLQRPDPARRHAGGSARLYESAAIDGAGSVPPVLLDHAAELRPT